MLYPLLMNLGAFLTSILFIVVLMSVVVVVTIVLLPVFARRNREFESFRQRKLREADYEARGLSPAERWAEEAKIRDQAAIDEWQRRLRGH